jgi:hypothetical protein
MNNVHPRVLSLLTSRLPSGSVIESATVESLTQSAFSVRIGDEVKRVVMPKLDVTTYLGGQRPEVFANEGDKWADVMAAISAKYRLYLTPGVDYGVDDHTVEFGDSGTIVASIVISPDSVHLTGGFPLTVKDKTKFDRPKIAVCCALGEQKAQLALVSKAFPTYDVIVIGAGGLPKGFVQSLAADLVHVSIEHSPSVASMLEAEVVELINDGVSDVAIFRTEDNHLWFVRYRLLDASDKEKAG